MDREILAVVDGVRNVLGMYMDFECLSIEVEMIEDGIASVLVYARRVGENLFVSPSADDGVAEVAESLSNEGLLGRISALMSAGGGSVVFHKDDEPSSAYVRLSKLLSGNKKQKMGVSL